MKTSLLTLKALIFYCIIMFCHLTFSQTQIGSDIDGEFIFDHFGTSVSMNADGTIVAVGSPFYPNGSGIGRVRIYQNLVGTWTQIGNDIIGDANNDEFGASVSMSANGSTVVISADKNLLDNLPGYIRVYQNIAGSWTQIGDNIVPEPGFRTSDSKYSVSISRNGSVVAFGSPMASNINSTVSGHVGIYQNLAGVWTQIGDNIEDQNLVEGFSVSLNEDGSVVALGAPYGPNSSGRSRIYQNVSGIWTQIGNDIDGEALSDYSGNVVSISNDGTTVAIGANQNDGNGTNSGHVRIYKNLAGIWTQIGVDIDGEAASNLSGFSVSLSANGTVVAIGAPFNGDNGDASGHVRIYQNTGGVWTQIGNDIDGETNAVQSGFSVSLSADGTTVAIGAPFNRDNGINSGHVRVYETGITVGVDNDNDGFTSDVDCNDNDDTVYPGASEICDTKDNDCDGFIDEFEGNALSFDGVNDRVEIPDNAVFDIESTEPFTIELWVRRTGNGATNQPHIFGKRPGCGGSINYQFFYDITSGNYIFHGNSAVNAPFPVNEWKHFAITSDGIINNFYIDGILMYSDSGNTIGPVNSGAFVLGNSGTCSNTFQGDVDELRFWSVSRTAQEINDNLYNNLNPTVEPTLLAYYPIDQGVASGDNTSITEIDDITASNLNGTPLNFTMNNSVSNFIASGNEIGLATFYADADGDGFGDPTVSIINCAPPLGYVTNNTDCDDANAAVNSGASEIPNNGIDDDCNPATPDVTETDNDGDGVTVEDGDCNDDDATIFPGAPEICNGLDNDCDGLIDDDDPDVTDQSTWFADTDDDTFGDAGNSMQACNQPIGYVANNTDCDDTDANLNPNNPVLDYSGSANYTSALVYPLSGATDTGFSFEVEYTDVNNALPPITFPRLLLDFEGNGNLTDSNDLTLIMTEVDLNDTTTSDGKRYGVSVPALPAGTDWESSVQVINGSCTSIFGLFNYPDVFVLPDLQIFANDITFSNANPEVSSEITVFATVHNISGFDALNFDVHLENQAELGTIYPDINVPILLANSTTTVSWVITTPSTDGWNPMLVSIDHTNVIAETLENNNTAIRPFTNGDFNVPGGIELTADASPSTTYNTFSNTLNICGNAEYADTAILLADPSVAGATVTITIVETGASYTTYTNSNGDYCFNVPVPQTIGLYNADVTVTDFTLSTTASTTFEIIEPPCLPDLKTTVSITASGIQSEQAISGTITVENIGCAATTITSFLNISNDGGDPVVTDEIIPILNPGETFSTLFSNITYSGTGSFSICAYADANFEIEEIRENNNYGCASISVSSTLPDLGGREGPSGNACTDNAPTSVTFSIANANTIATGAFTTLVNVRLDGNFIQTITENISDVAVGETYSFTEPFSYGSAGDYAFEMIIDSNNDIEESDELNNTITFNQTITTCLPNLTFNSNCEDDWIDVSVDPMFPGTATYSAQIHNKGNGTATGPFNVEFIFSGGQTLSSTFNGILSPGESTTVSVDGPTVQSGTETLTVNIDVNFAITESNELDNSASGDLCWDFSINTTNCTSSNFWEAVQPVNKPVYFSIGVNLSGLYDASAVEVQFEVSGPGIAGTISAGIATINDLESNCYCPYRADLEVPFVFSEPGIYTVTATIDPSNNYEECNETNNVHIVDVNVTDLPDMQILSQYINPSELNPNIGEVVNINVTYENIGNSNTGETMQLCVYADGALIETVSGVAGLLSGMNNTISLTSTYSSLLTGSHILSAEIDCNDEINESYELNNVATRAIVVGDAGNLIFTSLTSSNASPNIAETIDIMAIVENEGLAEVDADVFFYYTDDFLTDIQIAGPFSISLDGGQNTTIQFPWMVLDNSTTITAKIINSSPFEYDYNDNEAELNLGVFDITFEMTPSCENQNNGSLTAYVSGGTQPYSYEWDDGSHQNSITGEPGLYRLTVTDNTGFSITTEAEILIDNSDSDDDSVPDCEDICLGFDDLADADNNGVPDGCDDDDDNDGILDVDDCNPLDNSVGEATIWYSDSDGDGFGNAENSTLNCTQPSGYVTDNTDCDDTDATIFPVAEEICDGIDNDCNGLIDDVNSAPTGQITSLLLRTDPVDISQQIYGNATFEGADFVSAQWDWGDNHISSGVIDGNNITGNHSYTNAGVYEVFLTLTDICGENITVSHQYVVIYDPSSGFVTGGGWIDSPVGAYTADPNLTGLANFGFVSKYKKGRSVPEGNTEFQFHAGDLNFKSTAYDWLIVAGRKAMFKGYGTINGQGDYQFILSAKDENRIGDDDTFRIKIWDSSTEIVVYDNQLGDDDNSDATLSISGGSIIVHNNNSNDNSRIADGNSRIADRLTFIYWPNPSSTIFNLRLTSQNITQKANIYIYDLNNKLVQSTEFSPQEQISFGEKLDGGIYFVKITQGKNTEIVRFVKY